MRLAVATLALLACADDSSPNTEGDDAFSPALGQWIETSHAVESDTCGTGDYGVPTGFVLEAGDSSDFVYRVLDEALEESGTTLECFLVDDQQRLDCSGSPDQFEAGGTTVLVNQALVIVFADEEHSDETWTTTVECFATGCTSTVFETLPCETVTVFGAEYDAR